MKWLLLAAACLSSACVTTRPWQRERLADPTMTPDGDVEREALRVRAGLRGAAEKA